MLTEPETLYQDVLKNRNNPGVALYFRKKKIYYPELLDRIDQMADKLYGLGIRKNSVITLVAPNVPETIITFYALNKIGAVVSVLHPLIPRNSLRNLLRETNSPCLLLLDVRYKDYEDVLRNEDVSVYFFSALSDLSPMEKIFYKKKYKEELSVIDPKRVLSSNEKKYKMKENFPVNEDCRKPSVYLQSGGTTGRAKTVVLNDTAIRFPADHAQEIIAPGQKEFRMIGLLPLFHGYGLSMGVHAPLMKGTSSYLLTNYDGKAIIDGIKKDRINILITVPYMAKKLLKTKGFSGKKLRNLHMTFIGADKPTPALFEEFDKRMEEAGSKNRLYEGYGLTETVNVCVVNTYTEHKKGSVGKPLSGVKVKIVDFDDPSKEMPVGKDGHILISGPCNCLGYLNTPIRQQPFYADKNKVLWVKTGDVGHVDKDGYLYYKNREKDSFKIAGYNIFPSDIEALCSEVEGVSEAAALFIPGEHPYIHLYIESHYGDDEALKEKVLQYLKDNLIKYSIPEQVTILPRFPRTAIGKIDRKALIHF